MKNLNLLIISVFFALNANAKTLLNQVNTNLKVLSENNYELSIDGLKYKKENQLTKLKVYLSNKQLIISTCAQDCTIDSVEESTVSTATPGLEKTYTEALTATITQFDTLMARRSIDSSAISNLKSWSIQKDFHGTVGTNIVSKVTFELRGKERHLFFVCHYHSTNTDMACHTYRSYENELEF